MSPENSSSLDILTYSSHIVKFDFEITGLYEYSCAGSSTPIQSLVKPLLNPFQRSAACQSTSGSDRLVVPYNSGCLPIYMKGNVDEVLGYYHEAYKLAEKMSGARRS